MEREGQGTIKALSRVFFFKRYRSSGTVFETIHAIRGRIKDGTAYI